MNVVIVHGFSRTSGKDYVPQNNTGWRMWVKEELNKMNIKCYSPQMPSPWNPKYSEWKKELDKIDIDEGSVLIGHSAGGAFLVRYISESGKKIKKLILVSPGKAGNTGIEKLFNLYGSGNYENVKGLVKDGIIVFTSERDQLTKNAYEYEKELGARVIKLGTGFGHFSSSEMKGPEFPELLKEILK